MPKVYRPTGGTFEPVGKAIYIEKGNRQCEIAAGELAARIAELGGKAGVVTPVAGTSKPGIYILPRMNPVAVKLTKTLSLSVTAEDPGPQGYVIRTTSKQLVVIGGDGIGALYGAMTLRQMIRASSKGNPAIDAADLYDRPDYRYRVGMHFRKAIQGWGTKEKDPMAAYRAAIDWMMRFKINLLTGYKTIDPRAMPASMKDLVKEVNAYAIERGVYPIIWLGTNVGNGRYDKGKEFENWDCVYSPGKGERFYCWSRDELAKANVARWAESIRQCEFKILFLHPKDGGGITSPEHWKERCELCRKRFGDNRWKASTHQFNLWARILKEKVPDLIISSPIYPYVASYASYERFPGIDKDVWRKQHRLLGHAEPGHGPQHSTDDVGVPADAHGRIPPIFQRPSDSYLRAQLRPAGLLRHMAPQHQDNLLRRSARHLLHLVRRLGAGQMAEPHMRGGVRMEHPRARP